MNYPELFSGFCVLLHLVGGISAQIPSIVWTAWHEESMPPLLIANRELLLEINPGYQFIVISHTNPNEHIQHPVPAVWEELSIDQQSRWIRLSILAEHGGIWMDPSVLISRDLSWINNLTAGTTGYIFYNSDRQRFPVETAPVVEDFFIATPPADPFVIAWKAEYERYALEHCRGSAQCYFFNIVHRHGHQAVVSIYQNMSDQDKTRLLSLHAAQKVIQVDKILPNFTLENALDAALQHQEYFEGTNAFLRAMLMDPGKNPSFMNSLPKILALSSGEFKALGSAIDDMDFDRIRSRDAFVYRYLSIPFPQRLQRMLWLFWPQKQLPSFVRRNVLNIKRLNPGISVNPVLWSNLEDTIVRAAPKKLSRMPSHVQRAWMKLAILFERGGLFLDAAAIVTGSLDPLWNLQADGALFYERMRNPKSDFSLMVSAQNNGLIGSWLAELEFAIDKFRGDGAFYARHIRKSVGEDDVSRVKKSLKPGEAKESILHLTLMTVLESAEQLIPRYPAVGNDLQVAILHPNLKRKKIVDYYTLQPAPVDYLDSDITRIIVPSDRQRRRLVRYFQRKRNIQRINPESLVGQYVLRPDDLYNKEWRSNSRAESRLRVGNAWRKARSDVVVKWRHKRMTTPRE